MQDKEIQEIDLNTKLLQNELYDMLEVLCEVCKKHNIDVFALYGTAIGAVRHKGIIPWDDDIDIGITREDYTILKNVFNKEVTGYRLVDGTDKCAFHNMIFPRIYKENTIFEIEDVVNRQRTACGCKQLCQPIWIDIFIFDHVKSLNEAHRKVAIAGVVKKIYTYFKLQLIATDLDTKKLRIKLFVERLICRMSNLILREPAALLVKLFSCYVRNGKGRYLVTFSPGLKRDCLSSLSEEVMFFPIMKVPFGNGEIGLQNNFDSALKYVYGNYMEMPPEQERKGHSYVQIVFSNGNRAMKK